LRYDFCIVGAGIIGLATAREILRRRPEASLVLLEKESGVATHQTGHNSGVIHAGVYYAPGSLKARLCREGNRSTKQFCAQHGIPIDVSRALAEEVREQGGKLRLGAAVHRVVERSDEIEVILTGGEPVRANQLIACAGLQSDRLARASGLDVKLRIIPFRGEYFRLPDEKSKIVRHLIYPVPDPELPFLGVHLTRMIGGHVTICRNAASTVPS
jgi:(S)-2-hydroxyglutarate dehydrogenase